MAVGAEYGKVFCWVHRYRLAFWKCRQWDQVVGLNEFASARAVIRLKIKTVSYGLYGEDIGFPAKVVAMETCSYKE